MKHHFEVLKIGEPKDNKSSTYCLLLLSNFMVPQEGKWLKSNVHSLLYFFVQFHEFSFGLWYFILVTIIKYCVQIWKHFDKGHRKIVLTIYFCRLLLDKIMYHTKLGFFLLFWGCSSISSFRARVKFCNIPHLTYNVPLQFP